MKSTFEVTVQSLRQLIHYLRYDLAMPADMIRTQVDAILQSLAVQEEYNRRNGGSK